MSTVLPAVISAVAGVAFLSIAPAQPGRATPASYTDRSPIAKLVDLHQIPGGARVVGWDFDPDSPKSAVHTYATVDHKLVNSTTANIARSDVATLYPGAGPNHGFNWFVPVPQGIHLVCISAANIGKGTNHLITCVRKNFQYGPIGSFDSVTAQKGTLRVKGWTLDGDKVTAALQTTVTIDGTAHTLTANASRPDVANARPGAGSLHGIDATYAVPQGKHTVCVTAKNIGYGTNTNLGCKTATLDDSPRTGVNDVSKRSGKLHVSGWAFDPDAPTTPLTVSVKVDSTTHTFVAKGTRTDVAKVYAGVGNYHGFDVSYTVPEGTHKVCITVHNLSYGSNQALACRTVLIAFTPTAALAALSATSTGATVSGWATDPDTTAAIPVDITVDGQLAKTLTANAAGTTHSGHNFATALTLKSGTHTVCAIARNVSYGTHNSAAACRTITLALKPIGTFESLGRATGSSNLAVTGWALDPDATTSPIPVAMTLDGKSLTSVQASVTRTDLTSTYPTYGTHHGISTVLPANDGEHTVCLTAKNVGGGSDLALGCKVINAVHPTAPSAPQNVKGVASVAAVTLTWTKPASDGGAPWTGYTITSIPASTTVRVGATALAATVSGLKASTTYTFTVRATNVAGTSAAGTSPAVTTPSGLAPQTTPAPVSTSRYIRNIRSATATELSAMRAEGKADALANPSGHRYLVLLDIGGQDQYDGGVVLSATTRFVSYANLVKDLQAYTDGYHSGQRVSAPVTIAVGTNNDMDVTTTSGAAWATMVVNPVASYAKRYSNMTVAGANDIEPGFRASYTATKAWLAGYLGATSAPFVFNGSADGCAWTVINRGCNNGWTMAGLHYLAAGAAPTRTSNLPQIYNSTMAAQWKYISLTGIALNRPRINFAGTLTEWTACAQTSSCGSLSGKTAWTQLWTNLQSDSRLKVSSLPYATDLRIDQ